MAFDSAAGANPRSAHVSKDKQIGQLSLWADCWTHGRAQLLHSGRDVFVAGTCSIAGARLTAR
eukprot:10176024-Lingulodinium_polyedra.AAC.1